jgi:hypothetical protein
MPKEISAKNLKVKIDAKNGVATISADQIVTKNQGTLEAGGKREANNLKEASGLVGDLTEGAVKGAMKGVVP